MLTGILIIGSLTILLPLMAVVGYAVYVQNKEDNDEGYKLLSEKIASEEELLIRNKELKQEVRHLKLKVKKLKNDELEREAKIINAN